jgi:beta-1,4-mannosyltransferase
MKLIVFPKDPNPYQDLLYKPLEGKVEINFFNPEIPHAISLFTIMPSVAIKLATLRIKGFKLIHIHWVYPFYVSGRVPYHKHISYFYISVFFKLLKLLNYKIVWTVHNVVPLSLPTSNDTKLMQKLAKAADVKIIHSSAVIDQMKKLNISTDNCQVIPIGTYGNVYPDKITAKQARKLLHIKPGEFVILFFGIMSQYKGIEDLINAFNDAGLPNTRLVIVGRCEDPALKQVLKKAANNPMIDIYQKFVADKDVSRYFRAADIVCLPFRKITTSSSVMLAMSFGKPIIAPRLGALNDLPDNVGYLYDPTATNVVEANLILAATDRADLEQLGKNAKAYSDSLSWDSIAEKTYEVYAGLAGL